MLKVLFSSLVVAVICTGVLCAQDATYYEVMDSGTSFTDMTADSSLMVGGHPGGLMRWTLAGGIEDLGAQGTARCCDLGVNISGNVMDGGFDQAALWLGGMNWQPLGGIGGTSGSSMSTAYDISNDGTTVVGLGWVNAGTAHAFRYDAVNGMKDLGSLGGKDSRANAVSTDGSVIVGWDSDPSTGWWRGAKWVNGVEELIDPNGVAGDAHGVSSDGTWIVGNNHPNNIDSGWLWSQNTGFIETGTLSGWLFQGHPIDVSDDGRVVVGWSGYFMDQFATIWTEETGLVELKQYLMDHGANVPAGTHLAIARAVSDDGTTIVGWAGDFFTGLHAFSATIPPVGGPSLKVFDDFNRPDSTNMGPDWIEMEGNTAIENNMGIGNSGPWMLGWMYHASFQGNYADSIQSVEFIANKGSENVRLMSGLDPNTWGCVSVKIQDNDLNGLFDRVFFESAINAGNWGNLGKPVWYDLATQTAEGTMTLYFEDDGDTAVCEIFNTASGLTEKFTADGILTFPYPITGQNFGIGHYNFPYFDNWCCELTSAPLMANNFEVSARQGGTVDFSLDAGKDNAGRYYVLLGSVSGTNPGFQLPGGATLPLNWDTVTNWTLQLANTAVLVNSAGNLDADGKAEAQLNVPGPQPATAVGVVMNFAFMLDQPKDYASNPVGIVFVQ